MRPYPPPPNDQTLWPLRHSDENKFPDPPGFRENRNPQGEIVSRLCRPKLPHGPLPHPTLSNVILKAAFGCIKRIADGDMDIFVGMVFRRISINDDLLPGKG